MEEETKPIPAEELACFEDARVTMVQDGKVQESMVGTLRLLVSTGPGEDGEEEVTAFLTLSAWTYPLVGQPIMRTSETMFVVPGLASESFAIKLKKDGVSFVSAISAFTQPMDRSSGEAIVVKGGEGGVDVGSEGEGVLVEKSDEDGALGEKADALGVKIAGAGGWLAGRVRLRAGQLATGMRYVGEKVSEKIEEHPDADKFAAKAASLRRYLGLASAATSTAAVVSATAAATATVLAKQMGKSLAASMAETEFGAKVKAAAATEKGKAATTVALSTAAAAGAVWDALDEAAVVLADAGAEATADVVSKRYGEEVGEVTRGGVKKIAAGIAKTTIGASKLGRLDFLVRVGASHARDRLEELGKTELIADEPGGSGSGEGGEGGGGGGGGDVGVAAMALGAAAAAREKVVKAIASGSKGEEGTEGAGDAGSGGAEGGEKGIAAAALGAAAAATASLSGALRAGAASSSAPMMAQPASTALLRAAAETPEGRAAALSMGRAAIDAAKTPAGRRALSAAANTVDPAALASLFAAVAASNRRNT